MVFTAADPHFPRAFDGHPHQPFAGVCQCARQRWFAEAEGVDVFIGLVEATHQDVGNGFEAFDIGRKGNRVRMHEHFDRRLGGERLAQ